MFKVKVKVKNCGLLGTLLERACWSLRSYSSATVDLGSPDTSVASYHLPVCTSLSSR